MTTTIGIIGLGQIGGSIGLALKARAGADRILGHSRDGNTGRAAQAMGAVDAAVSLRDAVKEAQIVFLCLPLIEIRETLRQIGPFLSADAVVIDTAPIKSQLVQWAQEALPAGRYHIGLVPALNPAIIAGTDLGLKAARADLFDRAVMMVVRSAGTPEHVEALGMAIVKLLGAKPMITDVAEADGIMTTAHVLPQLAAAALIGACVGTGGWLEARKLAGRPFTSVSGGAAEHDDPQSVEAAVLANPERTVHGLDVLIAWLQGLRDDISNRDAEGVGERLRQSYRDRELWLQERAGAAWLSEAGEVVDMPDLGDQLTRLIFGGRFAEKKRPSGQQSASR